MLYLEGVSKKHGSEYILSDVTLELPNTGLIVLQGKDKRGITALLRILAGLERPDSGSVNLDGVEYTRANCKNIRRNLVTLVSTEAVFSEFLRGKDQMELVSGDAEANAETLGALGLAEVPKRRPQILAVDDQLKLSAARGIARSTPVLLVDSPSLGMTEAAELQVFGILKALSKTRLVIFVPRLVRSAHKQADLIVTLEDGKVQSAEKEWTSVGKDFLDTPERRNREQAALELGEKRTQLLQKTFGPAPLHRVRNALKAGWKSIRFHWVRNLFASLAAVALILLYGVPMVYPAIDASQLAYEAYQKQGYNQLVGIFGGKAPKTDAEKMTEEKFRKLCEKYGVKGIEYLYMDSNSFEVGPCSAQIGGMSNPAVQYSKAVSASTLMCTNIGLLSEGYSFPLAAGTMPQSGEFLITDYLADRLIAEAGVSDYAEILSDGIRLPGAYPAKVSGIIATDYLQYSYYTFYLYSPYSITQMTEEEMHANYNYTFLYSSIFTPEDSYFHPENGVDCVPINYGREFADIRVVPLDGTRESGCYSNCRLDSDFVKSPVAYGEYRGIEETIQADRPTIFVTEDIIAECAQNIEEWGLECEAFSIPLTSPEMLDELAQTTVSIYTPISEYYEDLSLTVQTIKEQAGVAMIVFLVLSVLWALLTWALPLRKQRGTFFVMLSQGYTAGHTVLYALARMSWKILFEAALILGGGYLAQRELYSVLQAGSSSAVPMPSSVFFALFVPCALYAAGLLAVAALSGLFYGLRNPWGYYRTYAKKHQLT